MVPLSTATHPCCISIKVTRLDDAGSEDVDCQVVPPSWVTNSCEPPGNIPSWALKNVGGAKTWSGAVGKVCDCQVAPPSCVMYNQGPVAQPVEGLMNVSPVLCPVKGKVAGMLLWLPYTVRDTAVQHFPPSVVRKIISKSLPVAPPVSPSIQPSRLFIKLILPRAPLTSPQNVALSHASPPS